MFGNCNNRCFDAVFYRPNLGTLWTKYVNVKRRGKLCTYLRECTNIIPFINNKKQGNESLTYDIL
jgi:hypothetical protein